MIIPNIWFSYGFPMVFMGTTNHLMFPWPIPLHHVPRLRPWSQLSTCDGRVRTWICRIRRSHSGYQEIAELVGRYSNLLRDNIRYSNRYSNRDSNRYSNRKSNIPIENMINLAFQDATNIPINNPICWEINQLISIGHLYHLIITDIANLNIAQSKWRQSFPIQHSDLNHSYVNINQRVTIITNLVMFTIIWFITIIS